MILNCDTYSFYKRYKRHPKDWSITDIHDLYIKLKKRSNNRHKNLWDYISYLKTIVPQEKNGEYIVYFNSGKDIRAYVLKDNGYTYQDFDIKNRDGKMSIVLGSELTHLGNIMTDLISLSYSKFKWDVYDLLNKKLQSFILDSMEKKNKPYRFDPNGIHVIDIQGVRYIYQMSQGILETLKEEEIIKI